MVDVTITRHSGPLTREDFEALRAVEDGLRYELIDGSLVVTPAPGQWHQTAVLEVAVLLRGRCPDTMKVMIAPFDVGMALDTVVQPDVLVARRTDLTDKDLPTAPLLAVEVLSPSTRGIDLLLKRERYERAGCPSYWVVDPLGPSLTVWERREGAYGQVATVRGADSADLAEPFPVTVQPAALVRS